VLGICAPLLTTDYGDRIEEEEMGGAHSTHQSKGKFIQSFGKKTLRKADQLEDLAEDGSILIWTFRK
jgi:hypothetical protein